MTSTPTPPPGSGALGAPSAPRAPATGARKRWRIPAIAWIAAYLAILDVAVGVLFQYPQDPRNTSPGKLQQYFEYGRSIEGKLARMTGPTKEASAPIELAGWLNDAPDPLAPDAADKPVVTVYGMSHAHLLAKELAKLDHTLAVRILTAPGATATWSYAAYTADRQRLHSDVVVLAVMTNTLPLLLTTAGTTMYFDGAYPYTYPRYRLKDGALQATMPPFTSLEDFRRYFFDRRLWSSYVSWVRENDKFYDPLLFTRTPLDDSSLVRLLRRSYALTTRAAKEATVYDDVRGFNLASEEMLVLQQLVTEFARQARLDGSIPVIYVVNNLRTSDHAFRALEPTLSRYSVPYLSSHQIVAPNEPRNYLPDSHFIHELDVELAKAAKELIHSELDKRARSR